MTDVPERIWVQPETEASDDVGVGWVPYWARGRFFREFQGRRFETAYVRADLALPEPGSEAETAAVERMARAVWDRPGGSGLWWSDAIDSTHPETVGSVKWAREDAHAALRALREGGE